MLAVHVAVVGGEDHVGVAGEPGGLERADDLLDALVHGEQARQLAAVALGEVAALLAGDRLLLADDRRLVGEVLLVERRRPRQLAIAKRVACLGVGFASRCVERE